MGVWQSAVVLYSPSVLHWPDRSIKGRCGMSHYPCICQVLDGGTLHMVVPLMVVPLHMSSPWWSLIAAILPRMWNFWFTVFYLAETTPKGFHLAFPTITTLAIQVREPVWEFCQLLSKSILIIHSRTRKINRMISLGTYCESDFNQNSINHLTATKPLF